MFFITNVKIQFRNVMSIIAYPEELEIKMIKHKRKATSKKMSLQNLSSDSQRKKRTIIASQQKRVTDKELKKIKQDRKRRLNEWQQWWN